MGKSLLEHMRTIPDYRCNREEPHDHAEMLTYLVAGYLNGRVSVGRVICWCEDNIEMLKKHMTLKQGIASEATISRMLNEIDSYTFKEVSDLPMEELDRDITVRLSTKSQQFCNTYGYRKVVGGPKFVDELKNSVTWDFEEIADPCSSKT